MGDTSSRGKDSLSTPGRSRGLSDVAGQESSTEKLNKENLDRLVKQANSSKPLTSERRSGGGGAKPALLFVEDDEEELINQLGSSFHATTNPRYSDKQGRNTNTESLSQ